MSDTAAGQPVEVPGDPPGSSTVAHEQDVPENHNGAGPPSRAGGHPDEDTPSGALAEDSGRANGTGGNANGTGGSANGGGANGTGGQARRRRGARGGRGRGRSAPDGSEATGSVPSEGSPPAGPVGPGAPGAPAGPVEADSSPPAPERPKIGDTRPARPNQAPVPVVGGGVIPTNGVRATHPPTATRAGVATDASASGRLRGRGPSDRRDPVDPGGPRRRVPGPAQEDRHGPRPEGPKAGGVAGSAGARPSDGT